MAYLSRSAERRRDVRNVLPSARSVIVTATVYNTDRPYSIACLDRDRAHIARYAWGDDYHEVLAARLDALVAWMHEVHPEPFEARVRTSTRVRSRSVSTRSTPASAGLARTAASSIPDFGSWLFLAEIICSLPLDPDVPAFDQCGTCTLCLEACPTQRAGRARCARRDAVHFVLDHRASRRYS